MKYKTYDPNKTDNTAFNRLPPSSFHQLRKSNRFRSYPRRPKITYKIGYHRFIPYFHNSFLNTSNITPNNEATLL